MPFLDGPLVDAISTIPAAARLQPKKKFLLQAVPEIPSWVAVQPKRGFMIPLARWLRRDLRDMLEDLLAPSQVKARGLFEPGAVARLTTEHLAGRRTHSDRLWTLMITELWMRRYVDRHRD